MEEAAGSGGGEAGAVCEADEGGEGGEGGVSSPSTPSTADAAEAADVFCSRCTAAAAGDEEARICSTSAEGRRSEGSGSEGSRREGRDKSGGSGSSGGGSSGGGSGGGGSGGDGSGGGSGGSGGRGSGGGGSGGGGSGGSGGGSSSGGGDGTFCGSVGVPSIYAGEPVDGVIAGAVAAMGEMGYYTAVEDVLLCLHRAMRRLHVAAARAAGTTPQLLGADALLPLLVWSVVHTPLPCGVAALAYAQRLCAQNAQQQSSELGYYLACFEAAISYAMEASPQTLGPTLSTSWLGRALSPLASTVGRLTAMRFTAASDDGSGGGGAGGRGASRAASPATTSTRTPTPRASDGTSPAASSPSSRSSAAAAAAATAAAAADVASSTLADSPLPPFFWREAGGAASLATTPRADSASDAGASPFSVIGTLTRRSLSMLRPLGSDASGLGGHGSVEAIAARRELAAFLNGEQQLDEVMDSLAF